MSDVAANQCPASGPRCGARYGPHQVARERYGGVVTARYRTRPQVNFLEFRTLEQRRVQAGNAIWAILAGARIASNTLNLTEGSTRTLAEIFPSVQHIRRFNLRSDLARDLLDDAESDLCTMGMSYAIALHEDFVKTCLGWLVPLGLVSRSTFDSANTSNVHELMELATGHMVNSDSLALFHLTRLMRNCHIHAGGLGSRALEGHRETLTQGQTAIWEALTGEPFAPTAQGDPVSVGIGGLIATLAIGKRLSYDVNLCLQAAFPTELWADKAAVEYFSLGAKRPTDNNALRSLRGYTRGRFDAIALTDSDLQDAISRLKGT